MEDYIFHFNDRQALQVQSDDVCQRLYDDFWSTILSCKDDSLPTSHKLSHIQNGNGRRLHWLARYGSVVIFAPLDSLYASVTLIGLDQWKSKIHASAEFGRERTALPNVREPAILELGPIPRADIDKLLQAFDQKLKSSEADNTGNRRGQSIGHQGNQKTPSFARAILWQVMEGSQESLSVQGGTTDVGLHTGCISRNTSFPLVLSTVHAMLQFNGEESDELFDKCVTVYYLSFLKKIAPSITVYDARRIDRAITIIRESEPHLLAVKDVQFRERVLEQMENYHKHLANLKPDTSNLTIEVVQESVAKLCQTLKPPSFPEIPDLMETVDAKSRLQRAKADAQKNLKWSHLSSSKFTGKLQDAWVQLCRGGCFFWKIATQLDDTSTEYSISDLRGRLDRYIKVIDVAHEASRATPKVMTVVLLSSKLLAIWITYCWAHRVAEEEHPLFKKYGAALDPLDLRHIVLEDARAIEAVECVRRFLGLRNANAVNHPFRKAADTRSLALDFGSSSEKLRQIYLQELEAAKELISNRWADITKTQRELSELDDKLRATNHELRTAEQQRHHSESTDFDCDRNYRKVWHSRYYDMVGAENRCRSKVKSLKSEISRLERKPDDVRFGLPRKEDGAVTWLFFLYMPQAFRDLSALAHLGQSMLWDQAPDAPNPSQNLLLWFKSHHRTTCDSPGEGKMILGSFTPPQRISTPNIREYSYETGIFFPDVFSIDPTWQHTNPFSSPRSDTMTTMLYTESLPQTVDQHQHMERFIAMLPTKTRENEGISWKERKPNWLTQEQYIAYSNLRACPRTQVRYLVEALTDNLLPFQDDCVHILVKQLLFHIGEADWKTDLDLSSGWGGLSLISYEMNRQLDILCDSPKDSDRLVLFGTMSSFFGQYDKDCLTCARGFPELLVAGEMRWKLKCLRVST